MCARASVYEVTLRYLVNNGREGSLQSRVGKLHSMLTSPRRSSTLRKLTHFKFYPWALRHFLAFLTHLQGGGSRLQYEGGRPRLYVRHRGGSLRSDFSLPRICNCVPFHFYYCCCSAEVKRHFPPLSVLEHTGFVISAENRDYKLEFQPVTGGELQHSLIIQKLSHSHTHTAQKVLRTFSEICFWSRRKLT